MVARQCCEDGNQQETVRRSGLVATGAPSPRGGGRAGLRSRSFGENMATVRQLLQLFILSNCGSIGVDGFAPNLPHDEAFAAGHGSVDAQD